MSSVAPSRREPAHLGFRGVFWRAAALILLFQAFVWVLAAGLAYLVASPELAKDYYSAHSTVKAVWTLLVPALAVAAGVGFLIAGAGTAFALWRYSRRLREPLLQIDDLLQKIGQGNIPPGVPAGKRPDPLSAAAAHLEPLRLRVADLQRISRALQKVSLEMNYSAGGTTEVTLKDLRAIAGQLDALNKELGQSVAWFGG